MEKFKQGDVIRTEGEYFAVREVLGVNKKTNSYITKFLDDNSIVETMVSVIDSNYSLKESE